jgi:serine/threonine-protein kinase
MLGQGTFGVVFLVVDYTLSRELAVKVLRYPSKDLLIRFRREATLLAKLRHPNIVPIHFVGAGEGLVFMAMPRLKGEPLRSVLQRQRTIPVRVAAQILSEVANALDQTHAAQIIHRDIKPENIFLEDPSARVQVMDFGVAKDLAQAIREGQVMSTIIGTLEYMSPEQCTGDPAIDGRSDVYSLACVLYEMLAGEPPFTGGSYTDLMRRHVMEQPRPLRHWRPDLSVQTESAISRALAKQPSDRFPTAGELATTFAASLFAA